MMTGVGVLLGTAAYMSPEQARGKAVDKRTDIWAFGCVLYEMLTGQRTFAGDDVSDTLAAVLRSEPDWNRLPANAPRSIRLLLRRCLQKDPKDRLQDIGDARIEIRDAQLKTDPEITTVLTPVSVRRRERVAWTLLAFSALALAALAVPATLYVRRTVPQPVVTRLDVVTPPTTDAFSFALSPCAVVWSSGRNQSCGPFSPLATNIICRPSVVRILEKTSNGFVGDARGRGPGCDDIRWIGLRS
jgi:serine/threonine protein kinase